jgi:hypothetical protein
MALCNRLPGRDSDTIMGGYSRPYSVRSQFLTLLLDTHGDIVISLFVWLMADDD